MARKKTKIEEEIKEAENKVEEEIKEEPVVEEVKTETVVEEKKEETPVQNNVKPEKKRSGCLIVSIIFASLISLVYICLVCILVPRIMMGKTNNKTKEEPVVIEKDAKDYKSDYAITGNGLEKFDLFFLKEENKEMNKVYSPLSIKYALEMLAEGTDGDTRKQIDAVIGSYKAKKYPNSDNMSFANAMFIRNTFKNNVKQSYKSLLQSKYNAEVKIEDFDSAKPMNDWISEKTKGLIKDLVDDKKVKEEDFILVNALSIDMKWTNQIHCATGSKDEVPCYNNGTYTVTYRHEKISDEEIEYHKTSYPYTQESDFPSLKFNGKDNYKSAEVFASFNRYNIVKELGEDKIKDEVGKAYKEWLDNPNSDKYDVEHAEKDVDKYLESFIKEINENYGKEERSSDFLLYDDNKVKAFAKDLKEYNGMTLQYVGIMPKNVKLTQYINNLKAEDVTDIIKNLKELKQENFKDGVVTLISGKIPLFKYEYELDLMKDLKNLGIKDVFDQNKADLSKMLNSTKGEFIGEASHKANIEFSNEGIKAAAASTIGGYGSSTAGFNYLFKVPVETIDITFDKPYMYIIRDKSTGEVWFSGTVYEPLKK